MSKNIFWVLEADIKHGELDNFKAVMKDMVSSTEANESDTLNYEWFLSEENNKCHIYERYSDSAAIMRHLAAFVEKFAERFMSVVNVNSMVIYGNPNEEVRNALQPFGALFMPSIGGFTR